MRQRPAEIGASEGLEQIGRCDKVPKHSHLCCVCGCCLQRVAAQPLLVQAGRSCWLLCLATSGLFRSTAVGSVLSLLCESEYEFLHLPVCVVHRWNTLGALRPVVLLVEES